MLIGILWALVAGLMLGLYALPGKYTKGFQFENTWGLFFLLTMFVVPLVATFGLMKGVGSVFSQMPAWKLAVMCVASFAWGCGVVMWGKAINRRAGGSKSTVLKSTALRSAAWCSTITVRWPRIRRALGSSLIGKPCRRFRLQTHR